MERRSPFLPEQTPCGSFLHTKSQCTSHRAQTRNWAVRKYCLGMGHRPPQELSATDLRLSANCGREVLCHLLYFFVHMPVRCLSEKSAARIRADRQPAP